MRSLRKTPAGALASRQRPSRSRLAMPHVELPRNAGANLAKARLVQRGERFISKKTSASQPISLREPLGRRRDLLAELCAQWRAG